MNSVPGVFNQREQDLLRAAVGVVARAGLRGLTHRAVDAEAGLPEGSCSAYMRTRLALVTRLTEFVMTFFESDLRALTLRVEQHAGRDDFERYAVQQTAEMLQSWLLRPELLLTRMELSIEGSRQEEVARIGQAVSLQLVCVVEQAMAAGGRKEGRTRATALIAAVDGVLLHALRQEPADRAAYMRQSLELLMGALMDEPADDRLG